jgi:hypothetical protein
MATLRMSTVYEMGDESGMNAEATSSIREASVSRPASIGRLCRPRSPFLHFCGGPPQEQACFREWMRLRDCIVVFAHLSLGRHHSVASRRDDHAHEAFLFPPL